MPDDLANADIGHEASFVRAVARTLGRRIRISYWLVVYLPDIGDFPTEQVLRDGKCLDILAICSRSFTDTQS